MRFSTRHGGHVVTSQECCHGLGTITATDRETLAWLRTNVHTEPYQWTGPCTLAVNPTDGNAILALMHADGLIDLSPDDRLHGRAEHGCTTCLAECEEALRDILNAADGGLPYSPAELVNLFRNIQGRARTHLETCQHKHRRAE